MAERKRKANESVKNKLAAIAATTAELTSAQKQMGENQTLFLVASESNTTR